MVIVLTQSQINITQLLACLSGSLSVLGAIFLIASFLFFKELRTHSSKLILYLSIADLGEAISWILSPASESKYPCYFESYTEQFFGVASCLWQLCISAYVMQVNMERKQLEKQEIIYHAVCWGIPLITIIYGGVADIFGPSGAWCWVKNDHPLDGILILYVPALTAIIVSGVIYVYVAVLLGRKAKTSNELTSSNGSEEYTKMYNMKIQLQTRIYILPFALGWLFGFVNRLHNLLSPNRIAALFYLQAIFFPLQGFWNFFDVWANRENNNTTITGSSHNSL
eukprot:TRINITY_DN3540_c0_g1_i3.p1 TRINITY_DN3540_c0_g1~~TRINITY_DN3540_c0_g1_i3.p1  ORF type:complete len:282 (+),score=33.29 TRINITY_DN3540_c0_g1_i3:120-965(+)